MFKVSLTSRAADFVGRMLIGSPRNILYSATERQAYEDHGVPVPDAPNFYLKEGDRLMPSANEHTWKVKRRMIYENQMRERISLYSAIYVIAFSLVCALIWKFGSGEHSGLVYTIALAVMAGAIIYGAVKKQIPSLSTFMPLDKMRRDAMAETNAVSRRSDVPHGKNTTADLDDVEGRWDLTPEGYRVTGRLLADDMLHGSYSPVVPLWLGLVPLAMILTVVFTKLSPILAGLFVLSYVAITVSLVGFWFLFWLGVAALLGSMAVKWGMGALGGMVAAAGGEGMGKLTNMIGTWMMLLVPALMPLIYVGIKMYGRARNMRAQGREANAASQGRMADAHVTARRKQAAMALKDKSPWIWLGESTGIASGKRDGFSPDAKKGFGQTLQDLGLHVIIWGASGTGKTSTFLARILRGILLSAQKVGALILDNKGSLPYDLKGIRSDYVVLSPEDSDVALLEGLTGEQRAAAFLAVVAEEAKGDNAYWINNGSTYVRHAFVFHEALTLWDKATYEANFKVYQESLEAFDALTEEEREAMPEEDRPEAPTVSWFDHLAATSDVIDMMVAPPEKGADINYLGDLAEQMSELWPPAQQGGLLRDACVYISRGLPAMDEKTRSNIKSQVDSWFAPLKSSTALYRWITCERGVDLGAVCKGAVYGLNTPEHKYKRAGLIASNMVKERVYSIVRNRPDMRKWDPADGWTQVVLAIDECQETISKSEDRMFAVARSKGLIGIFAAQSLDTLVDKMGEKSALAFLGNIASVGTFRATEATYKYMQSRLGMTENVLYTAPTKGIDYNYSTRLALTSPDYDPTHPYGRLMKGFIRSGGFSFKSLFTKTGIFADINPNTIVSHVERKIEPLFDLAEMDTYLQNPFTMVMQVNRAGVRRRDIINCRLIDIQTGEDIDPFAAEEEGLTAPPVIERTPAEEAPEEA